MSSIFEPFRNVFMCFSLLVRDSHSGERTLVGVRPKVQDVRGVTEGTGVGDRINTLRLRDIIRPSVKHLVEKVCHHVLAKSPLVKATHTAVVAGVLVVGADVAPHQSRADAAGLVSGAVEHVRVSTFQNGSAQSFRQDPCLKKDSCHPPWAVENNSTPSSRKSQPFQTIENSIKSRFL